MELNEQGINNDVAPIAQDQGQVESDIAVSESTPVNPMSPAQQAVDLAAKQFDLYKPLFKNGIQQLSRKQLIRLITALVEYPMQAKDFHHAKKFEKDCFTIGNQLLESKYMMILFTMLENQEITNEIEKAVNNIDSQTTQNDEGVSNG